MIGLEIARILGVCYAESMASGCSNNGMGLSASSISLIIFFILMVCNSCPKIEFVIVQMVQLLIHRPLTLISKPPFCA
jgi:hypothetical protein